MNLSALLAMLSVLAIGTSRPLPRDECPVNTAPGQTTHGVYYCDGPNWSGNCKYTQVENDRPYRLETGFKNNLLSAGADAFLNGHPGVTGYCALLRDDCDMGHQFYIDCPGYEHGVANTPPATWAACIYCKW